jgi:hypothetical protein
MPTSLEKKNDTVYYKMKSKGRKVEENQRQKKREDKIYRRGT